MVICAHFKKMFTKLKDFREQEQNIPNTWTLLLTSALVTVFLEAEAHWEARWVLDVPVNS